MVAEWCHCMRCGGVQIQIGKNTQQLVESQAQDLLEIQPACCIHSTLCSQLLNASWGQQIFSSIVYNLGHVNESEFVNNGWEHLHVPGKPILCNSRMRWTTAWLRELRACQYACSAAALVAARHSELLSGHHCSGSMPSSFSPWMTLARAISYFSWQWMMECLTAWRFGSSRSWGVSTKCSWVSCADNSSYFCLG